MKQYFLYKPIFNLSRKTNPMLIERLDGVLWDETIKRTGRLIELQKYHLKTCINKTMRKGK